MSEDQQTTVDRSLLETARKMREASIASRAGIPAFSEEPRHNPFWSWTEDTWPPATPPDGPDDDQEVHTLVMRVADESRKMFFDASFSVEFRLALAGVMIELGFERDYWWVRHNFGFVWAGLNPENPPREGAGWLVGAVERLRKVSKTYPESLLIWVQRIKPFCEKLEAGHEADKAEYTPDELTSHEAGADFVIDRVIKPRRMSGL